MFLSILIFYSTKHIQTE